MWSGGRRAWQCTNSRDANSKGVQRWPAQSQALAISARGGVVALRGEQQSAQEQSEETAKGKVSFAFCCLKRWARSSHFPASKEAQGSCRSWPSSRKEQTRRRTAAAWSGRRRRGCERPTYGLPLRAVCTTCARCCAGLCSFAGLELKRGRTRGHDEAPPRYEG